MQIISRKQIMQDVELTCIKTDKFKTGCLSINIITQLDSENASKNAVLPQVLRRGTALHPDMESIAAALDNLYGARIDPVVRKKGERQCIGFYSDFIDDKFVPDGENVLEKVIALVCEILLAPNTYGGRLIAEYVDSERDNVLNAIRAAINDKRQYSVSRLVEHMCEGEKFGTNKLGSIETANKISVSTLTKHYRQLIASCFIEVIYCGSAQPERVERAVMEGLATLPRSEALPMPGTDVVLYPKNKEVRFYKEAFDVTQGKLAIGFRLGEGMLSPNYAVLLVLNAVFGGAVTSKLFLNVREKLSLCYFASSNIEKHKGVMIVSSGIDFDKYDEALGEILLQLEAIKTGEIEDWELDSAKSAVITALKTADDQPGKIEDYYLDQVFLEIKCTPDELAALVDEISKEDVIKAASGVKTDTVYFLTGERGESDDK